MAGYSGTLLIKKLGIKAGMRIKLVDAPLGFDETLGPLPDPVAVVEGPGADLDCVLLFVDQSAALRQQFEPLTQEIAVNGMLWVGWPKKAARVPTDLNEDIVRQTGLDVGWVDVKVCAIDEKWSGLKFVRRLKDRPPRK